MSLFLFVNVPVSRRQWLGFWSSMPLFLVVIVDVSSPQCRLFCKTHISTLFSSLNRMVAKVLVVTFRIVAAVVSAARLSTPQGSFHYPPRQSNEVPGQRV